MAAFAYVRDCPFVDARRIVIGGHSVGGLVTIIASARLPMVRAVVSINGGITWTEGGFQTGYPAVQAVWGREGRKIKVPVLLLQGNNDTLIRPELSRSLAEILRKQDTPVELNLYSGGHHWFPVAELIRFLDANLKSKIE